MPVLVPPLAEKATVAPPVVTLLPAASFPSRITVAADAEASVAVETVTPECVAEMGPGVPVSEKRSGANPVTLAWNVCAPAVGPSVAAVCARPESSVTTRVAPTALPPAPSAWNCTDTPFTPNPSPAVTRTRSGWASAVETTALCVLPPAIANAVARGTNVTRVESRTAVNVRAMIVTVSRRNGARTSPNALTRARSESLVCHAT